jgi:hypothetical protein
MERPRIPGMDAGTTSPRSEILRGLRLFVIGGSRESQRPIRASIQVLMSSMTFSLPTSFSMSW